MKSLEQTDGQKDVRLLSITTSGEPSLHLKWLDMNLFAFMRFFSGICDPILGITPIGDTELVLNQSQTVNLRANVVGHPIPTITWYTNANEMIRLPWTSAVNSKYVTVKNKENFTLTIVNASVADSGTYLLTADNRENKTQQSFTLKIFGILKFVHSRTTDAQLLIKMLPD